MRNNTFRTGPIRKIEKIHENFSNEAGFTLIELVVPIVIMVIIATMGTITQLSSYDSLKLDAAAQRIAADLRYAQLLVMDRHPITFNYPEWQRKKNSILIRFNVTSNSYQVQQACCTCSAITDPHTQQPYIVDFDDITEYKGVTITGTTLNPTYGIFPCLSPNTDVLVFTGGDGWPGVPWCNVSFLSGRCANIDYVQPGNFAIQARQIQLEYKGKSRLVIIQPETGEVKIQ